MFRSSLFDKCLEKATSHLLLEPDWDSMLQIVDAVRQNDVQPKLAVLAIRKKIAVDNPHVASYALQVLETCVKNCGATFHQEVATKDFMEFLKDQVKVRSDPVKGKILELIQTWSHAFRNEPSYRAVEDTFHLLKMEGHKFPVLKEADAMFSSEKAPEWKDGETCTRCRVQFGMVQRKHHCRNCGYVFCQKCSSKNSIIPKFGIEREVRVCDSCYDKINKAGGKKDDEVLPSEYLASPLSKQSQVPPARSEQEIAEEEELQLALALSRSEAESKEKERDRLRQNYGVYGGSSSNKPTSHPDGAQTTVIPSIDTSDMDPELARYLNRNYWQKRSEEAKVVTTMPSAPIVTNAPQTTGTKTTEIALGMEQPIQNGEQSESEKAQFLAALQSSLEIFVNRMRSNSQRGRPIANDSSVQSLFTVISNMHPQLLKYQQELEDSRSYFEGLQDKLTQLRDAREALDSLREEHREKRRRELEEMERQRQIQMMQKLEIMRQKKHEYLEMQRQLALQRLQEQERELAMRLEQQKQLTHMRQMQTYGYPQVYGQMPPQSMMPGIMPPPGIAAGPQSVVHGYSPARSTEGSPVHHVGGYGQSLPQQNIPPGLEGSQLPQGMYMPPGVSQSVYTQPQTLAMGPGGNQAYIPQLGSIPGGYQSQGQNQPHTQGEVGQPPQAPTYVPSVSMGYVEQGPPSMGQPSIQGGPVSLATQPYSVPPLSMDYSSFNMQSMAGALPQQNLYSNQQLNQQPGQQYIGGMPATYPNQMGPPSVQPHQQQPPPPPTISQQQPPIGQQPPIPQHQQAESLLDAQLISFD
ncbi:hepatocyte growth factor-regulated tyrosine kinase substrate-like [Pomacea canaliculata]|uniref:hepatocyte growth factor-regulated tyrosine kinase substrate-like n=1 Tax=Pomacea canaliculata TaxID=400727 RepID=UPI000D72F158|nr:hepatocyte growth factor-regulated tyrosine kinase substrate-like [Pomacea canaliculata]